MGLATYSVTRDNFEADGGDQGFSFPCCVCVHRHGSDQAEPCRTCDHNANAVPHAASQVSSGHTE